MGLKCMQFWVNRISKFVYLPTVAGSLPVRHTQTGLQAVRISRSRKSYIALEFFARDILYTIYDIRI